MPIKKIISARVPIKIWTDDVEKEAVAQLENVASLPFVFKHVAVMPDVHAGKGATVGSVVATLGAVSPASIGVDIGCGIMALKTTFKSGVLAGILPELRHSIERSIPVGFNSNLVISKEVDEWQGWESFTELHRKIQGLKKRAGEQLCSLGGGNHFIEVCLDTEDNVWLMLHSGSRNIGKSLAEIYIDDAKSLMRKMFISLPDPDLAYFAMGTEEYKNYLRDLSWCQAYAMKNRELMMKRVVKNLGFAVGREPEVELTVNCHHNFAVMENHFGVNVLVTRKGAVRAKVGDMGIIPGSMGTKSYIVEGLGNEESFHSCSHGAGRRMSRTKARATFKTDDLVAQTIGVECRKDVAVIDEIPGAYKPIEQVMENQSDLVKIVAELKQVLCVKG